MNHRKRQRPLSWYTIYFLVLFFIPQWIFTQGVLFQNTSGDTLAYISDEGGSGSIKLKKVIATPSNPTHKLYNVGGNLHWGNLPLSHMWNKNGSHVYYTDGKVGIGEMAPTGDLEVFGVNGVLFKYNIYGGSGSIPASGAGTRMMWYPGKAAFRVGSVTGTHWDDTNISLFSVAMGSSTIARGYASTAFGAETVAGGEFSSAFGTHTNAIGYGSTSFGAGTTASGFLSTALGWGIEAAGEQSIGIALNDQTSTIITNNNTMAIMGGKVGINTVSPGENLVVKMGGSTWADPHFAIENHNTTDQWDMTIGNNKKLFLGYNETSKVVVDTMGKVGIGIVSPSGDLHVSGEDGVLFEGPRFTGGIPKEGAGTRMMWYLSKAAFRAGEVTGVQWDKTNIGNHSVAFGLDCQAKGINAIALGNGSIASGVGAFAAGNTSIAQGEYSVAMGFRNNAIGLRSVAFGNQSTASGTISTAFGYETTAGGTWSTAFGSETIASGDYSTAMGVEIEAAGEYTFAIALNDQNGNIVSQDNTMAIMGGKVGIGDKSPEASLEIHSSGTTEDPLRVRVGSVTKFRVWASNGSVSMGANVIGPDDGLLVKGNINPSVHKGADLGANGTAWDDIYYDDLHNQGASAFDGRVLTEEIIEFPPLPKRPGSFDYRTERGDVELDPASMPPGLADENSLLTDEITSYNYKANYEQQLMIEMLRKQVKELEKRLKELEKMLKD